MLICRILPFAVIGGGYLVCKSIFSNFPLRNITDKNIVKTPAMIMAWLFSLLIMIGQIAYILKIVNNVTGLSDSLVIPILIITFFIMLIFGAFVLYKYK